MTNTDEAFPLDEHKFLELVLLGINYVESRIYGDGEIANLMEETMAPSELYLALAGLSSSFISMSSDTMKMPAEDILENVRSGVRELMKDTDS